MVVLGRRVATPKVEVVLRSLTTARVALRGLAAVRVEE